MCPGGGSWRRPLRKPRDTALIGEGILLLERSPTGRELTAYHLEAAIAATHACASSVEATDWGWIVSLYDRLLAIAPSPVVALNHDAAQSRPPCNVSGGPGAREGIQEEQMKPHARALVGAVLMVAGAAPAMAADFSVRDLRGSYVVQLSGERRAVGLTDPRHAAVLGRLVADGEGGMQATVETVVTGAGFTMRGSWFNCTYTVEPDGTGRMECPVTETYPAGPLIRFDRWSIVVSARGDEFAMLYRGGEAPPGAPGDPCMDCVLSGTAKRQ